MVRFLFLCFRVFDWIMLSVFSMRAAEGHGPKFGMCVLNGVVCTVSTSG